MERDASRMRSGNLYFRTVVLSLVVFAVMAMLHRREFILIPGPGSNVSITLQRGDIRTDSIQSLSVTTVDNHIEGKRQDFDGTVDQKKQTSTRTSKAKSIPKTESDQKASTDKSTSPKVALMFLSRARLHNEPVWRAFFEAAGRLSFLSNPPEHPYVSFVNDIGKDRFEQINQGQRKLLQMESVQSLSACDDEPLYLKGEVDRLLTNPGDDDVIAKQHLFSVYTHPSREYSFRDESIFRGTEIADRIGTTNAWASFALVAAEINLLKAALSDKQNIKFVLLSESCIPLHRPEVVYLQLLSEEKSRLNGCHPWAQQNMMSRWDKRMRTKYLSADNWRKSSQWFCLNRAHAEVVATETHVLHKFKQYCRSHSRHRCVPDEHYIPTALAVYGLDNETDCKGHLTATWWLGRDHIHPVAFSPRNTNAVLWKKLRHMEHCAAGEAQVSTQRIFHTQLQVDRCLLMNATQLRPPQSSNNWVVRKGYVPMGYGCALFARKFAHRTVMETTKTALACAGGALGYWC